MVSFDLRHWMLIVAMNDPASGWIDFRPAGLSRLRSAATKLGFMGGGGWVAGGVQRTTTNRLRKPGSCVTHNPTAEYWQNINRLAATPGRDLQVASTGERPRGREVRRRDRSGLDAA